MQTEKTNNDNFFSVIDRISSFAIINLLWIVISLFIITLPAATAGLFAVCSDWVQGKKSETFERFFIAFRRYAVRSTLLILADSLGLGFVALNLSILPRTNLPGVLLWSFTAITISVGLVILAINLYLWTLLVNYEIPLQELAHVALRLVFRHPSWSLALLVICAAVLISGLLFLPRGLVVLILFSTCALLISWGSWHIIQQYDANLRRIEAVHSSV